MNRWLWDHYGFAWGWRSKTLIVRVMGDECHYLWPWQRTRWWLKWWAITLNADYPSLLAVQDEWARLYLDLDRVNMHA